MMAVGLFEQEGSVQFFGAGSQGPLGPGATYSTALERPVGLMTGCVPDGGFAGQVEPLVHVGIRVKLQA